MQILVFNCLSGTCRRALTCIVPSFPSARYLLLLTIIIMKTAARPFNDVTAADIIVRTEDGVNFYIYSSALTSVSSFFEHLLSDATLGSMTVGHTTLP